VLLLGGILAPEESGFVLLSLLSVTFNDPATWEILVIGRPNKENCHQDRTKKFADQSVIALSLDDSARRWVREEQRSSGPREG